MSIKSATSTVASPVVSTMASNVASTVTSTVTSNVASNTTSATGSPTLSNTYIQLELSKKNHLSSYFMNFMSYYIGAKSKLNYHMGPSMNNRIIVPVYPYEASELHMTPIKLIQSKIDELINVFENIDWNNMSKQYYWLIHGMRVLGFDPSKDITLTVISESPEITSYFTKTPMHIYMKTPTGDDIIVEKVEADDKSLITTIVDPHAIDYGIYVDLSVPFDEMGMLSNGLHLYEHLVTKAWENLNEKDHILMNGATNAVGISWVYSLHRTYESFKEFMNSTLKFFFNARSKSFWESDKMKNAIKLETIRTISETRNERSNVLMARSDIHAYDNKYPIDAFYYWANKPFNMLCVVTKPEERFITKEKLNGFIKRYPLNTVPRPPNRKYKNIPVEVLVSKMAQKYKLEKADILDNAKKILTGNIEKQYIYGIDCKLTVDAPKIEENNTVLHAILFYNRNLSEDILRQYCNTHLLPFSNQQYSSSIFAKFSSEFY